MVVAVVWVFMSGFVGTFLMAPLLGMGPGRPYIAILQLVPAFGCFRGLWEFGEYAALGKRKGEDTAGPPLLRWILPRPCRERRTAICSRGAPAELMSAGVAQHGRGVTWQSLSDPGNGLRQCWVVLAAEAVLLLVLGWYLEQVCRGGAACAHSDLPGL